MKVIFLPSIIHALVFDIDQTLYRNDEYTKRQTMLVVAEQARKEGKTFQEAQIQIENIRRVHKERFGYFLPLGKVLEQLGTSLEESAGWYEHLFDPENYLKRDGLLVETIEKLASTFKIAAVTNNSMAIGLRILQSLGIREFFMSVAGIERAGECKPSMALFEIVAKDIGSDFHYMVSIGDNDIDVYPPVRNGMGGILVESMQDIYALPSLLNTTYPHDKNDSGSNENH